MIDSDLRLKEYIEKELKSEGCSGFDRSALEKYQLIKLNKTLLNVQKNSGFYQKKLLGLEFPDGDFEKAGVAPVQLSDINDIRTLPFTTAEELERDGYDFYCIRPDGENRIISVTAKTEFGSEKKIVFTKYDRQRTVTFLNVALSKVIGSGDRVLLLFPCRRPDVQGDLIRQALENIGASMVPYGPLSDDVIDWGVYIELLNLEEINCIMGMPSQVANLAEVAMGRRNDRRYCEAIQNIEKRMKTVVLGMDYVKQGKVDSIKNAWNCTVSEFYGREEIGFACTFTAPDGKQHYLRETDIFFEIINPLTLEPAEDGKSGELVVTTLTREGMPLVRYRTGNRAAFAAAQGMPGNLLRCISRVEKRL